MTQFVDNSLRQADKYFKNGEISEARRLYDSILSKFPMNIRAKNAINKLNSLSQINLVSNPSQNEFEELVKFHNLKEYKILLDKSLDLYKLYPNSYLISKFNWSCLHRLKIL